MTIQKQVREIILNAAADNMHHCVGNEKILADLDIHLAGYTGHHPIPAILSRLDTASAPDSDTAEFRTPLASHWQQAIWDSGAKTAAASFQKAERCFRSSQTEAATEHLCDAVTATIAAIAATRGWPHLDSDDILNAMVALASGVWPTDYQSLYRALESAPETGQNLNSAYAAAMGQPSAVRSGAFDDAGMTPEDVFLFATTAVNLARELGEKTL